MNHKIVAALLLLPFCLPAQEPPPDAPASARNARRRPPAVTVTLEFDGGTMEQFVAAVRKEQGKANIVLADAARDARVPSLELKDAGIEQALEGACMAAEADYDVRVREFDGVGQPVYSIVAERSPVRGGRAGQVVRPGADDQQQRVMSLNTLIKQRLYGVAPLKVDTVLSAIELALSDEAVAPRVRFHEDSGLLLVRGTMVQVDVVEQILRMLQQDLQEQEQRALQGQMEKQRQQQIQQAQGR